MGSTFGGIEISKRSLFAHQTALSTTGHNIANADTKGYSRQVVNLVASRPIEAPGLMRSNAPGQLGQGVEFDYIKRVREKFLDSQYYNENKSLGEWSKRADTLEKLEAIINEPSDTGIRQVVQNFWNAWQELSKAPDNLTARAVVKENALALTDAFNNTSQKLKDLSADLTSGIDVQVAQINSITQQVAALNQEIYRIEGLGNDANDLRDQRDLLVDELSGIANVSVTESASGYAIRVGGIELVNGRTVSTTVTSQTLQDAYASGDLSSGEAYGLIVSRDSYVANYQKQLDTMVKSFVEGETTVTIPKGSVLPEGTVLNGVTYTGASRTLTADLTVKVNGINQLHQLGYTGEATLTKGEPFFTLKAGATEFNAESVTVNPNIVNNVAKIAASMGTYQDTATGTEKLLVGNNNLSLVIAGLKNSQFNFDPTSSGGVALASGTLDNFFQAFVGQLGIQSQEASRQSTNQQVLVDQVDSRRQSVSGVSLDEEMANMIKYQHSYNAAARVLTTFDEMLDKVINSMGVVGR